MVKRPEQCIECGDQQFEWSGTCFCCLNCGAVQVNCRDEQEDVFEELTAGARVKAGRKVGGTRKRKTRYFSKTSVVVVQQLLFRVGETAATEFGVSKRELLTELGKLWATYIGHVAKSTGTIFKGDTLKIEAVTYYEVPRVTGPLLLALVWIAFVNNHVPLLPSDLTESLIQGGSLSVYNQEMVSISQRNWVALRFRRGHITGWIRAHQVEALANKLKKLGLRLVQLRPSLFLPRFLEIGDFLNSKTVSNAACAFVELIQRGWSTWSTKGKRVWQNQTSFRYGDLECWSPFGAIFQEYPPDIIAAASVYCAAVSVNCLEMGSKLPRNLLLSIRRKRDSNFPQWDELSAGEKADFWKHVARFKDEDLLLTHVWEQQVLTRSLTSADEEYVKSTGDAKSTEIGNRLGRFLTSDELSTRLSYSITGRVLKPRLHETKNRIHCCSLMLQQWVRGCISGHEAPPGFPSNLMVDQETLTKGGFGRKRRQCVVQATNARAFNPNDADNLTLIPELPTKRIKEELIQNEIDSIRMVCGDEVISISD